MNGTAPPLAARRRQLMLLAALLALLAVWWYQRQPTEPTPAASNPPVPAPSTVQAPSPSPERLPEEVRLASLGAAPDRSEVGRNPFGYGTRPAPPAPGVAYTPAPMPPSLAPSAPQGPPPVPLSLAGMVSLPDGRTLVTLTDRNSGAVFQAVEGDVVDGRYRVVEVNLQSVVVSYLDGSGRRTIPLGG